MDLILIQKTYPPAVIKNEDRQIYFESLSRADRGSLTPFVEFIAKSLLDTQDIMIAELKKGKRNM